MQEPDSFHGDEDAALRYAIELSLRDSGQNANAPNILEGAIVIDSDDDDDGDLDKGPKFPPLPKQTPTPDGQPQSQSAKPVTHNPTGLAGLDRRQMEAERLARLRKRKAPDSAQSPQGSAHKTKTRSSLQYKPDSATTNASDTPPAFTKRDLQYPKGVVKKTWAFRCPRDGDDIKIEEVLKKDELELAVLSSYQWDEEWLLSKVDTLKTRLLLIAYASDDAQRQEMTANVPDDKIRFCFPQMMPFGTMHSKLQVLKYAKSLRIVVPSGNLVPYDWGETGVMENMLFLIDLPYLEDAEARAKNELTNFGEELSCFLNAQGLEQGLIRSLKNYDFTETRRYGFVHSIGQSITDERWQRTGYCGLGKAVSELKPGLTPDIEVDYVTSSLGAVKLDFVRAIYYAAQGDSGLREHSQRPKASTKVGSNQVDHVDFEKRFRIYFPSYDTVVSSRGGRAAAGTICAQSKWWNTSTFPRELIRDCKSVRSGLLMHNKLMLVRCQHSASAWAYLGSANFSESAWGRLTVDKKTGDRKMTCRNWECGVLIAAEPPRVPTKSDGIADMKSAFKNIIPIPMLESTENYGASGSKRPWLFLDHQK